MALGALEPKFWFDFCQAVERPDWETAHFSLKKESNSVYKEVIELFRSKNFQQWIEFSKEVDCCLAPVLEVGELKDYPYFKEKETFYCNKEGSIEVSMHADSRKRGGRSPQIGEHNQSLLNELLGSSKDES
jgi:crotonobetainyl-CoA:carnitine CoA-transferase CaiB-like acyl-CoA transferase